MADIIREQVLAAIVSTVSGEYGVPAPDSEADLPITIVQDEPDTVLDNDYNYTNLEMPVAVAVAAVATSTDKNAMRIQAHNLLGETIVSMFEDETFGALADGIEYAGGGIQTEVGKFIFSEAQFIIRYHHVRGDPFTINEVEV